MNILASYKWIQEYVRTKLAPEEFAARISLSGPSIERIYPQGENLEKIVVGEIVKIKPHPNADKLRLVDARIGKETVKIVCGGTNLREGMKLAVALVGARVKWHGEGELVELKPAEIRGVKSAGMICAANEIGLFDYFPHKDREIMDLSSIEAPPGTLVREALGLDDVVFDIEVTTNRPDAFSMVGLAREAAAILEAPFLWKPPSPNPSHRGRGISSPSMGEDKGGGGLSLDIKIDAPKLCPRYQAAVMTNVQVKPSPWWMQKRLLAAGIRPISNIVDITNYVMLELGQPMHAFDAERLQMANSKWQIVVRNAEKGEKIKALDGNTYELEPSMLVIADVKNPIAIAGVMGGEDTGVTRDTTTIIFESANFDPVSVRRTARALNLHSDSSLRFEKGLSTESTTAALARAVELAQELAGATLATPLLSSRTAPYKQISFSWNPADSTRAIGVEIPVAKMKKILTSLGFEISGTGKSFRIRVPFWRDHDIESANDFTEEIARVYGYHKLPSVIPTGELPVRAEDPQLVWEDRLREVFRGAGFTEVYSNSFVSEEILARGMSKMATIKLQNPLTEDLAVMRPSLVPSHLQIAAENSTEFPEATIFEIANVYLPRSGELPRELLMCAGAIWGESPRGELFSRAKGMLQFLSEQWNIPLAIVPKTTDVGSSGLGHPGRRAVMAVDGHEIGIVGEVHPAVLEKFGIKRRVAIFQFDLLEFVSKTSGKRYEPIPAFPPVRRDISFVVARKTSYDELLASIKNADKLIRELELFDVYEGKGIREGKKSLAFHLTFSDPSRTLTGEEVDVAFGRVVKALEKLGAEVRVA